MWVEAKGGISATTRVGEERASSGERRRTSGVGVFPKRERERESLKKQCSHARYCENEIIGSRPTAAAAAAVRRVSSSKSNTYIWGIYNRRRNFAFVARQMTMD